MRAFSSSSRHSSERRLNDSISFNSCTSSGTNPALLSTEWPTLISSGVAKYASRSMGLPLPERLSNSPRSIAALIFSSINLSSDISTPLKARLAPRPDSRTPDRACSLEMARLHPEEYPLFYRPERYFYRHAIERHAQEDLFCGRIAGEIDRSGSARAGL